MRLSALQKYIILQCFNAKGGKISRVSLDKFYLTQTRRPVSSLAKIITQSLERLINKELLIGYGVRTPHKWFIREVKLTAKGKQVAKKLMGEQMKIPFKKEKSANKKQEKQ